MAALLLLLLLVVPALGVELLDDESFDADEEDPVDADSFVEEPAAGEVELSDLRLSVR